jgi:serine/threonine protein kinase
MISYNDRMDILSADRAVYAGRYRLERVVGRGPSGVVYAATEIASGRSCALKRLHAHFHEGQVLHQVQRDALAAAKVAHPGVLAPSVAELDAEGRLYLISELAKGESLRARAAAGPLPIGEITRLFQILCAALDAAHRAGLSHGDLTPSNILCPAEPEGQARICDFGMSRLGQDPSSLWGGAPGYIPPEVYRGEVSGPGPRADVFALGALLFLCLTGRRLFDGPSAAAVMFKVCVAPLPSVGTLLAGRRRLEALLAMACDKDPEARFDNPAAFWRALEGVVSAEVSAPLPAPRESEPSRDPRSKARSREPRPAALEGVASPPRLDRLPVTPPAQPAVAAPREGEAGERREEGPGPAALPPPLPPPPIDEEEEAAPGGTLLTQTVRPPWVRSLLWAGSGAVLTTALLLGGGTLVRVLRPGPGQGPGNGAQPAAPQEPGNADAAMLLQAEEKLAALDYAGALSLTEPLLRRRPGDPQVEALHKRAGEMMRAGALYQGFVKAVERGDIEAAMALHRELPADSPYRVHAAGTYRGVRARYMQFHLDLAAAASRNGACEEVERQVAQVQQAAERGEEMMERGWRLVERCRPRSRGDQPDRQERGGAEGREGREGIKLRDPFVKTP